jgi:hypothetical protein
MVIPAHNPPIICAINIPAAVNGKLNTIKIIATSIGEAIKRSRRALVGFVFGFCGGGALGPPAPLKPL